MKVRLFVVAALLLLWAGYAHADPISLTAAVVTALLPEIGGMVIVGTITVADAIATAVVVGGAIALNTIMGSSGQSAPAVDPTQAKSTFESNEAPELRVLGLEVRIGGLKIFGAANGTDRCRLIAHCRGPINGDITHYLAGREVLVDPDGSVQSPPYVIGGLPFIYIWNKAGDGTETAWPLLMSLFPGVWTADHQARGIAQTLIRYISPGFDSPHFLKLYQQGPPEYERKQPGEAVYDPRTGLTAPSDNGIVNCLHVALMFDELSLADFDLDYISDEADKADVLVATLTGTEPRSRLRGVLSSETGRATMLAEALTSAGAEIVPRPGDKLGIRLLDDDPAAEFTLPLRHILDLKLRSGPEAVERPNVCAIKYYSPERNYSVTEIDMSGIGWARIGDEVDRFGSKIKTIELKMCPSASQAQRIARRIFALLRADQAVVRSNMYGLAVWGCRTIATEFPDLDLTATCAIAPPRVDDAAGAVEIPFAVFPGLAEWNPASDEAAAPTPTPDIELFGGLTQPAMPSEAAMVPAQVRVACVMPDDATIMEANFRVYTGATPGPWTSMVETYGVGGSSTVVHAVATASVASKRVEFRVRGFDDDGNASRFSPYLDVTFPATDAVAPAEPLISKFVIEGGFHITVTPPTSLNVYSVVCTGPSAPETPQIVSPGVAFNFTHFGADGTWTAQAFNGSGVGSAIAST